MNILILILILFLVVFLLSITNKEDFMNLNFKLLFKPKPTKPELDKTYMRCFHIKNQTSGSLVIFMQMTSEFKALFNTTKTFNPTLPSDGSEQYENWDWLTKQGNVHGQFEDGYFTSFVLCELEKGEEIKIVLPLIKTKQGVGNIYERPSETYTGWGLEGCRLWGIKNNSPLLFKYSNSFSASTGQRVLWSSPDFKNTTKFEFTFQTLKPDIHTNKDYIIGDAFNLSIIPDPCGSGHFNKKATAFYTQKSVNYGKSENDFSFNFNDPNLAKLGCNYNQTDKQCDIPGENIKAQQNGDGDCVENTCSIVGYPEECRHD